MQLKLPFRYFILLTIMLSSACSINQQCKKISSDEAYNFIEFFLRTQESEYKIDQQLLTYKNDNLDINSILDRKDFNEIIGPKINFDTLLSADDDKFMKKQVHCLQNERHLNAKQLGVYSSKIIKKPISAVDITRVKFNVLKLGFPLFSIDKKVAVIYTENYCGIECGQGNIQLFKKQLNGEWKRVSIKTIWIS